MTDSTDNARGPELLPCPFCGAKDGLVTHSSARGVYVECRDGCGAYGPDADNGDWNMRRADLAPDPLRAVKIKPLVWEYHPAGAIAATPTGFAYIIDTRMKGRVYSLKGFNPPREFPSMGEAKAAAQADYEARIRSALEPDPQDARVKALVEPNPPADRAEAANRLLDHFPPYPNHPAWDALFEKVNEGSDEDDCIRAWLFALAAFDKGRKTDG